MLETKSEQTQSELDKQTEFTNQKFARKVGQEQQEVAAGDRPGLAWPARRGLDCTLPSEQSTDQTNSAFYFWKFNKKYESNSSWLGRQGTGRWDAVDWSSGLPYRQSNNLDSTLVLQSTVYSPTLLHCVIPLSTSVPANAEEPGWVGVFHWINSIFVIFVAWSYIIQ